MHSEAAAPRSQVPVILFKTPSPDAEHDPYARCLATTSYRPVFVPVLDETYDGTALERILEGDGAEGHWEGVVITSRRGAEGWVRAVQDHLGSRVDRKGKAKEELGEHDDPSWDEVPLYTVGTASSDHLARSDLPHRYMPRLPTYAEGQQPPKSAAYLAPVILCRPPRKPDKGYGTYLVVRGDKSMDYLPDQLNSNGRRVKEVVVYSTTPAPGVSDRLASVDREGKGWLAFFSPSGAKVVLPLLDPTGTKAQPAAPRAGSVPGQEEAQSSRLRRLEGDWTGWRVFVIGETTRRYLEDEQGIRVDAVGDSPNPGGLLAAIQELDGVLKA
ncbi:hypothetical protein IAU60_000333 [Kwoniella sp. DSM 27419]